MKWFVLALALAFPLSASAQVPGGVVAPSAVVVTIDDAANVTGFKLILHSDLTGAPGALPAGSPVVEMTIQKPVQTSAGVFTLPLAQLLAMVAPPDRLKPLLLWIASENSAGLSRFVAASSTFTVNAPIVAPHAPLSVALQP